MAFAILHGAPQVFYWGEPYGGAIGDAYPAAVGFWLFGPSTLVLRMASAVIAVLWAWSVWFIARRAGAGPFAFLAGLLVAVPPVFPEPRPARPRTGRAPRWRSARWPWRAPAYLVDARAAAARGTAWAVLGLASGLSWWSSQIAVMVLVSAAVVLAVQPRVFRRAGPYVALALFFLASWPFWVWNARHEWATFRHLATWGGPLPPWSIRFKIVGEHAPREPARLLLGRAGGAAAVLGADPELDRAAGRVPAGRARRAGRGGRVGPPAPAAGAPWQDALDLVVVAFWATVAAHLLTWFGTSTVLRYAMTFQATLPVLCAMALARVAPVGRGTPVAGLLAAALLGFNLVTHVAFVTDGRGAPWRPVDAVIARLEALRNSYLLRGRADRAGHHVRVERASALQRLRRVPELCVPPHRRPRGRSVGVAIVTHRALRRPHPDVMAADARPPPARVQAGGRRRLRDLPRLRGAGARHADRPGGMGARASTEPESRRPGVRSPRVDPVGGAPAGRPVVRAGPRAGSTRSRR